MLYYSQPQIVLKEVPDEISLALSISGCPKNCVNCHSVETHDPLFGKPITNDELVMLINKHKHITCVLFYGGLWDKHTLISLLNVVKLYDLKTCLYTGYNIEDVPFSVIKLLNYLKVGEYIEELGTLADTTTNQKMLDLVNKKDITYKFQNMRKTND